MKTILMTAIALMIAGTAYARDSRLPLDPVADKYELCAMLTTHAAQVVVYERYCGVQGYMLGRTTDRMEAVNCPKPTSEARQEAYRRQQLELDTLLQDMPNLCSSALAKDVIGY